MFCFLFSASGTGIKEGSPVFECEAVWIFFVFRVTKNLTYSQCEDSSTSKCVIILLICNGYFNSFTQWEIFYLWYTPLSITYSTHNNDPIQDSELNNAEDSEQEGRCVGKWGSREKNEIGALQ